MILKLRKITFGLFILSLINSPYSYAQDNQYPAGSIGFLYEKCQSAIKKSPDKFAESWCATFLFNYSTGMFGAAMANHHRSNPNEYKPECLEAVKKEKEVSKEYIRCNGTLGIIGGTSILEMIKYFFAWAEWLKANDPETLNKPISPHINSASYQGQYCTEISNNGITLNDYAPHPDFQNLSDKKWDQYYSYTETKSDEVFENCLEIKNQDRESFFNSMCGAYFTGLYAGIYITDTTIGRDISYPHCEEDIQKLHEYLILAKDQCLPKDVYVYFQHASPNMTKEHNGFFYNKDINLCKNE